MYNAQIGAASLICQIEGAAVDVKAIMMFFYASYCVFCCFDEDVRVFLQRTIRQQHESADITHHK
jgi:hypothetical protein